MTIVSYCSKILHFDTQIEKPVVSDDVIGCISDFMEIVSIVPMNDPLNEDYAHTILAGAGHIRFSKPFVPGTTVCGTGVANYYVGNPGTISFKLKIIAA